MESIIGYSCEDLLNLVEEQYGRGKYHAKLLFENLYKKGILEAGKLNDPINESYSAELPPVAAVVRSGDNISDDDVSGNGGSRPSITVSTIKFLLKLDDGYESETIILPMGKYNTLCISSQIGCRWSCAFCETGKLGMKRNLTAGEILSQLMTAQLVFKKEIRNIVFMGMGEPLDNFENVIKAIDIISHPWAMNLNKKSICISTVGNVDGLMKLNSLAHRKENDYHKLHIALSLNGADDEIRSQLMPVNKKWPLAELKNALQSSAQYGKKDLLYLEYVLIKGLTDGEDNGKKLIAFAGDFPMITLNLIPYNPGRDRQFEKPEKVELDRFHRQIVKGGIRCFTRYSQGEQIMAACGQLGNKL